MAMDDRFLRRPGILAAYDAGPRIVRELFERAYVLVYPVIPAAVATLAIGGHLDAMPRFWAIVLLAEFISYGMMPWLQTRPPRAIESAAGVMSSASLPSGDSTRRSSVAAASGQHRAERSCGRRRRDGARGRAM